jgi:hypothetical protein
LYTGKAKSFTTENHQFSEKRNFIDILEEDSKIYEHREDFKIIPHHELFKDTPILALESTESDEKGSDEKLVIENSEELTDDSKSKNEEEEEQIPEHCQGCEEWKECKGSTLEECINISNEEEENPEENENSGEEKKVKKVKKVKK